VAVTPRTREILGLTAVVLLVVAVATAAHLASVARITLGAAADEGRLLSRQLLHQAAYVLKTSGSKGVVALRADPSLRALLDGIVGYSRVVVYGTIVDASERAILHSDPVIEGRTLPQRTPLDDILDADLASLADMLLGPPQIYEVRLPVRLGERPFGTIRVGVSTSLVRQALRDALLRSLALGAGALVLALAVGLGAGRVLLRYLQRIARRVERLARRDAADELAPGDDMARIAERMKGLGERIQEATSADAGGAPADRLQNAVLLLRPDGTVAFQNPAATALLGQPPGDLPIAAWLAPEHPVAAMVLALLRVPAAPRHETVTLSAPSGETRECAVSGYPVPGDGATGGALLVLRDLEPVRAVESLVTYSQKLAALGRLTSGVTHQVKNPLNAMRIHLELLRVRLGQAAGTGGLSPDVAENLDVIGHEIQRLDRVVQGFLRFIRPQDVRLAPVDLNALLEDLARLARPAAAATDVEIVLDLAPALPRVTADAELITQACTNLVTNAVQAMPGGGTVILASRRAPRGGVEIRVTDQGVGIPPEEVDKIFRLYYTTKPEGSGIGLALVYRIVQMHDGRVDVESIPGKGTTMTVTLPESPAAP
jgi:signal transduction histidine kinase